MSVVWQTLKDPKTYVISECVTLRMDSVLNADESPSDNICWLVSHLCSMLCEKIKQNLYSIGPIISFSLFAPTIVNQVHPVLVFLGAQNADRNIAGL